MNYCKYHYLSVQCEDHSKCARCGWAPIPNIRRRDALERDFRRGTPEKPYKFTIRKDKP